jgi:hypothetical protein
MYTQGKERRADASMKVDMKSSQMLTRLSEVEKGDVRGKCKDPVGLCQTQ